MTSEYSRSRTLRTLCLLVRQSISTHSLDLWKPLNTLLICQSKSVTLKVLAMNHTCSNWEVLVIIMLIRSLLNSNSTRTCQNAELTSTTMDLWLHSPLRRLTLESLKLVNTLTVLLSCIIWILPRSWSLISPSLASCVEITCALSPCKVNWNPTVTLISKWLSCQHASLLSSRVRFNARLSGKATMIAKKRQEVYTLTLQSMTKQSSCSWDLRRSLRSPKLCLLCIQEKESLCLKTSLTKQWMISWKVMNSRNFWMIVTRARLAYTSLILTMRVHLLRALNQSRLTQTHWLTNLANVTRMNYWRFPDTKMKRCSASVCSSKNPLLNWWSSC